VLEDNCRTPSGVSYMLENREVMMRLFPDLFAATGSRRWRTTRTNCWRRCARWRRPTAGEPDRGPADARPFNSAYYEHSFLADEMGIELVEGADLVVEDDVVLHAHHRRPERVDVIYRRIDDDYLDPWCSAPTPCSACPA
jgi:uncharacterized circularly permuted ATP-grasp superfamily protein